MRDAESHKKPIDEVVRVLQTNLDRELSDTEVQARLRKYAPNELTERPRLGFLSLLLNQFNNFLVIILIVAAVVTVLLSEYIDAIAITVIIVLNAVLGVIEESKAEQAIAALKYGRWTSGWKPGTGSTDTRRTIGYSNRATSAGTTTSFVREGNRTPLELKLEGLSPEDREIILAGCLINHYAK
jgi:hypothetical protein